MLEQIQSINVQARLVLELTHICFQELPKDCSRLNLCALQPLPRHGHHQMAEKFRGLVLGPCSGRPLAYIQRDRTSLAVEQIGTPLLLGSY